jgi:hypothetical protein
MRAHVRNESGQHLVKLEVLFTTDNISRFAGSEHFALCTVEILREYFSAQMQFS